MKIKNEDFEKGEVLLKKNQVASDIDLTKEIETIESQIWDLYPEYERARVLLHSMKALEIRNKMDILRGKIMDLQRKRHEKIEKTERELNLFLKPFRNEFMRKLKDLYITLEREKMFDSSKMTFSFLGLTGRKIKTNLGTILKHQIYLSRELSNFEKILSLRDMAAKAKEIEEKIPKDFPLSESFSSTEQEASDFGEFFREERLREDWIPSILPEGVLENQLNFLKDLSKEKIVRAA